MDRRKRDRGHAVAAATKQLEQSCSPQAHGEHICTVIVEFLVILALNALLLFPSRARLRDVFTALPWPYALVCLTSVGLLLAGHAISRNEDTYPLVAWDMYTENQPGDPHFVDYVGVLASGREERLLLGRLFPAGGRHLRARIDSAAEATVRESSRGVQLGSLLAAVVIAYDARHPTDSLRSIRVLLGTVPARAYTGPQSISRRLIYEYSR